MGRDGNLDENPDRVHTPLCVRTNIVREIESGRVFDDSFIQTCQQFYNKDKQNTDPYVFGSHFYYSCCRQTGVMLDLEVGDMIIFFSGFGKKPKRKFVLDTVFIVGGRVIPNKISYQEQLNVLRNLVSLQYLTGVILPICCGNNKSLSDSTSKMKPNNVLYYGAMYNDQSNQPERVYSFFPCKKAESDKGFSRYVLFDEETGEGLCRVLNVRNKTIDINQNVYSLWQLLQKDVQDKGFLIGVKANEPDYSDIEI